MDEDVKEDVTRRKIKGQEKKMSFGAVFKAVVLIYVSGRIYGYIEENNTNPKKKLQNVLENWKGVSMVSPWTMEKRKNRSNIRERS